MYEKRKEPKKRKEGDISLICTVSLRDLENLKELALPRYATQLYIIYKSVVSFLQFSRTTGLFFSCRAFIVNSLSLFNVEGIYRFKRFSFLEQLLGLI